MTFLQWFFLLGIVALLAGRIISRLQLRHARYLDDNIFREDRRSPYGQVSGMRPSRESGNGYGPSSMREEAAEYRTPHPSRRNPKSPYTMTNAKKVVRLVMSVLISVALVAAGLYVIIVKGYGVETEKWAYGALGLVVGFWVKE